MPEPVDTWQNLNGGGNILDAFYKDPERYAYTFQNYVFLTRVMQVAPLRRCLACMHRRTSWNARMACGVVCGQTGPCVCYAALMQYIHVAIMCHAAPGSNAVYLSTFLQEKEYKESALRLLERSVFSDRMVFVKAVHESRYMTDLEMSVYNSWLVLNLCI